MRKDEKDPRNKKLIRAKMNYYSLPEGWVLWNSPLSIVLVNINWRFPPFRIIFVSVTIFINVPVLVFSFHTSFDNTCSLGHLFAHDISRFRNPVARPPQVIFQCLPTARCRQKYLAAQQPAMDARYAWFNPTQSRFVHRFRSDATRSVITNCAQTNRCIDAQ